MTLLAIAIWANPQTEFVSRRLIKCLHFLITIYEAAVWWIRVDYTISFFIHANLGYKNKFLFCLFAYIDATASHNISLNRTLNGFGNVIKCKREFINAF